MAKTAKRHPIDYRTRELLTSKLESALRAMDSLRQLTASFHEQIERYKWRINAGEKLTPAEVDRFAKHLKHEAQAALQALGPLHQAMCVAYPKMTVLWAQEAPGPWDPPSTEGSPPIAADKDHAEGSQTVARDRHLHTTGPDQHATGSPNG